MKIDGAENDVFSAGADTTDSKLAPTSENPDRKALRTASASPPPVIAPPVIASPVTAPAVTSPPITASPPIPPPAPINRQAAAVNPGRSAPTAPSPAPVAVAHPPATHAPETHLVTTGTTVQLAALTSEEAARNEWQQMAKRMPDLLNGRQPIYARTERDGHVYWRVRTAGFADISQARGFCDRVRAKGGDCSVAEF
jgi:cell division septation protein DedD